MNRLMAHSRSRARFNSVAWASRPGDFQGIHGRDARATARGGFTLVEMMVATTLVVMMMLMFAQIYVAAIESLGEQQAVARNDGKARLADIILRGDLDRISYLSAPNSNQGIVPLVKDDVVQSWQRGFFYISENDQTNPNDDVLHFTTSIKTARNRDQSMYYGRATNIPGTLAYGSPGGGSLYPNHPEIDDGDTGNGVGASRDAEICYFVRAGNLYRRVLLIRDIDLAGVPGTNAAQPFNGTNEFNGTIIPTATTPSYYKAFDYSAYYRQGGLASLRFLGTDALQNHSNPTATSTESLGCSMTRFGFAISAGNQSFTNADLTLQAITRARGTPVEYDSLGNFFGRPLHAETGSIQWQWPGTGTNPLLDPNLRCYPTPPTIFTRPNELSLLNASLSDADVSGTNYTRATEDLLLSNVEAFDIEVWDSGLFEDSDGDGFINGSEVDLNGNGVADQASGFVQLGNSAYTGYFRSAQQLNSVYGPGGPSGSWVFDTGHPEMWTEDPARAASFKPPYRPLQYRLAANQVFPVKAAAYWTASTPYVSGTVVFKVDAFGVGDTTFSTAYRCVASGEDLDGDRYPDTEDLNGNNSLDPGEDRNGNGILDKEDVNGNSLVDSTVIPALPALPDRGSSGNVAPAWPTVPGQRVTEGNPGNQVTWEAFDNRIGLQKIRITVRVRDPKEDLPRQFSIIHSFANPTKSN